MSFICGVFGRAPKIYPKSKPKKVKKVDFEYKVIEKKRANGTSYFIGESTLTGRLQILTEDKYIKSQFEDRRMRSMCAGSLQQFEEYKPLYRLMDACESISRVVKHAQFKDPCEVKELICSLRREMKEKATNLKYSKVISIGECPCK